MAREYQDKKEYLVLSLVKKYPLYSLDKLAAELPGISRHSIQRILEKNKLSTVERRLGFNHPQMVNLFSTAEKAKSNFGGWLKQSSSFFQEKAGALVSKIRQEPRYRWLLARNLLGLVVALLVLGRGYNFVFAGIPEVQLEQPTAEAKIESEKILIKGKVSPKNSLVTVNGAPASLNGDGSFTALVSVPVGESPLKIEAANRLNQKRKSQVLRLVYRSLTKEEIKAEEDNKIKAKKEAASRAAQLERTVNDLLAVKNATADKKKNLLKIINSRIKEEEGFSSVVGEVTNLGGEGATWVMVTVIFYDAINTVVDTKYGFATSFGQVLKSGETASFETQPTTKPFDHYSLSLTWEEPQIGGTASGSAETKSSPPP